MFKEVKNNKVFLVILTSASLVIWGVIVYQIIWGANYEPEYVPVKRSNRYVPQASREKDNEFMESLAELRNPFMPAVIRAKQNFPVRRAAVTAKPKPPSLDMKYLGFLKDKSGSLAILEGQDGETKICEEGDRFAGMRVARIEKNQVILEEQGRKRQLLLQR